MTKTYVGIDLGTTNSVICSYDGEELKLYKSPEQQDVTPSAIYLDKRSKYFGFRAYQSAARSPDNAAILFKRLMGTSTPIRIPAMGITMSPEECSAEILRVLYSYIPEAVRNDPETGTVITVPAAFNQMQKDATLAAAEMAGIGRVALMQEPVSAVMSVMRTRKSDGMFLIYDLGGGTLDIALAESVAGRVTLHENGGIAMNGGRDWDRAIVDNVIKPWLLENFALPDNFSTQKKYQGMMRLLAYHAEQGKIRLSASGSAETPIYVPDAEVRIQDENGEDIYLDVTLSQSELDRLVADKVNDSIEAAREVLSRAHLTPDQVQRVVFVGGPTQYRPLREKVAFELGIEGSTDVNPMVAVAEGAAIFAESIDWSSQTRGRKSSRGSIASKTGDAQISLTFQARTPDVKARLGIAAKNVADGATFQIDSLDTGWSSGRMALTDGATATLPLAKQGENRFKVFVFDPHGGPMPLPEDTITVTRTTASIDAIPASHSIGVTVKDRIGGQVGFEYLVKAGDALPKKGRKTFRAEHSLRAGATDALRIQLWEGEIENPPTDNRMIGTLKISGSDFDEGVIQAGAELQFEYEVADSGNITATVSVPSIAGTFNGHSLYSRQEGQIDFTHAGKQVEDDVEGMLERINSAAEKVSDEKLDRARAKLEEARERVRESADPEACKQSQDQVLEARRLLSKVRKEHLSDMRAVELERLQRSFDAVVRDVATPAEVTAFSNVVRSAERVIATNDGQFEHLLENGWDLARNILWKHDGWIVDLFHLRRDEAHMYSDQARFEQLIALGDQALRGNDIPTLRQILGELSLIRIYSANDSDMLAGVNILRG
ncbi:Hsp70 family protein [Cupriavidus sp. CP313]